MMRRRHGLTLIELLAAAMILSAVAAAGVRLTLESRIAAMSARLRLDAIAVLERWRAEIDDPNNPDEWRWTDASGRRWRVRRSDALSPQVDQSSSIQVQWRIIEVIAEIEGAPTTLLTLRGVTPATDVSSSSGTNTPGVRP